MLKTVLALQQVTPANFAGCVEYREITPIIAWCLSWSFLNAKRAVMSLKPLPLAMVAAVAADTVIYGKKTLQVNGCI